jgi:hypothetical protein
MATIIKFLRGEETNLPSALKSGEPAFTTDSRKLFIGSGIGRDMVATADLCNGSDASGLHSHDTQYMRMQSVVVSEDYQASGNQLLLVDTSVNPISVTLPLPANLVDGDIIEIIDIKGNSSINNITVIRNGNKLFGQEENFIFDLDNSSMRMVYLKSDENFKILNKETLDVIAPIDCGSF